MTDNTKPTGREDDKHCVHHLKTWPIPFAAVRAGLKPWELRKNDRDFRVGDLLRLHEWRPETDSYTGEVEERLVMWKLDGGEFGLPPDFVIMSLSAQPSPSGGAPAKLGNTPTDRVLSMSADMLDEAAQRLGGLVDMPVMARKLRELAAALSAAPTPPATPPQPAAPGVAAELAQMLMSADAELARKGFALGCGPGSECRDAIRSAAALLAAAPQPAQGGWSGDRANRIREAFLDLIADASEWDEQQDEDGFHYNLSFNHHSLSPLLAELGIEPVPYPLDIEGVGIYQIYETPAQAIHRVSNSPAPPADHGKGG